MSDIRQKICKALIASKVGLTTREISEDLKTKIQVVNGSLSQMAQSGFINRGEYLEGEGQIWEITALGVTEYGSKSDVESALTQTVEVVAVDKDDISTIVEILAESEPVTDEIKATEIPINKMELETFDVFQLTDNLASSFISLMQSKKEKPIENIDYKIATLESLADIYNPKISATLREIAADLRA
jgi:DNA-binding MarR family transcriptional regulator